MTYIEWILTISLIVTFILAIYSNKCAYQEGFFDGCQWFREGPTYPNKPKPGWSDWEEVMSERERAREYVRASALREAAGYFHDGPWRCSRASRILEALAKGEERPDGEPEEKE